MSTSSLRCWSKKYEINWSKAPSLSMPRRDLNEAGKGGVRVLMTDVSYRIGWGYGRCFLFENCRLTPASWLTSLDANERLPDWSAYLSWEFDCLKKPAAIKKLFTDFRNAAQSTIQSCRSRASCSVSPAIPNLVFDCVFSLAGLRFVQRIWLICCRFWAVTSQEYWWLVAKKSNIWKAWVIRSLGGGDDSLSFVVYKKREGKNSERDFEKKEACWQADGGLETKRMAELLWLIQ